MTGLADLLARMPFVRPGIARWLLIVIATLVAACNNSGGGSGY